ncbi:helix-turn-helix domain-containing protein [Streptodolium elevatio]
MPRVLDPADSIAALFGARVKRLREAQGWTQEELGEQVRTHSTRVNQIERATGHRPTLDLARRLDDVLGADNLLVELWTHLYKQSFPDWSQEFMSFAAQATMIREYAAHAVPGLLQTESYARALLRAGRSWTSERHLAERLAARMDRQLRLQAADRPGMWVVLDEAVLRRPVGGPVVMREQLARLLATEHDPDITVQLLLFEQGEHPAMGGSLTLLTLPDGPTVAYTEGADYGRLVEDKAAVEDYAMTYDHVRALALPPSMSLRMIETAIEETTRAERRSPRTARSRMAQVELQQSGRRQLPGGRRPRFRHRPRP